VSTGPDAVLFDLDGVLIDSYEVWFHLMNAAARDLGYDAISREGFHRGWGQGLQADREAYFPRHELGEVAAYYERHFADHLAHLRVSPHVERVFAGLAARSLPSAVITNTPTALARDLVARAGARPREVVGGDAVPRPKPAPDMVLRACALLDVAPERALVVGDSRFDRDAARAAGARFAGLGIPGDPSLDALDELLDHL
jgi:phosphoglycolate phosphatase/AHBA synthesis associated protein